MAAYTPRMRPLRLLLISCAIALLAACGAKPSPATAPQPQQKTMNDGGGAISSPEPPAQPMAEDVLEGTHWPAATVGDGRALAYCEPGNAPDQTHSLVNLEYFSVVDALEPCRDSGYLRLHYRGRIDSGFADLVERVSAMARRMGIRHRVLELDSAGGHVEDAMRAGDIIGANAWTIWVGEGASCHSACALVLAAGDDRLIGGEVGIHRMIRMTSSARSRRELNQELRAVHAELKDYLERNGAAVTIADLMMTVPSRELRMLTREELRLYGLDGANAAQQDLDRLRVLRDCGEDFLRRKETFLREFANACSRPGSAVEEMHACARPLLQRHGFPDGKCPDERPMADYLLGDEDGRGVARR